MITLAAGTGMILRCHPAWRNLAHFCVCRHILTFDHGESPPSCLLQFSSPSEAHSTYTSCCTRTTGSSLGGRRCVYYLFFNGLLHCSTKIWICQPIPLVFLRIETDFLQRPRCPAAALEPFALLRFISQSLPPAGQPKSGHFTKRRESFLVKPTKCAERVGQAPCFVLQLL